MVLVRQSGDRAGTASAGRVWLSLIMASALVALAPRLAPSQEPAARKTIRKIAIQGLSRESESDISARLSIQIGDIYDPQKVSLETGKLYATRKFRKVEPPQVTEFEDGVAITFVVVE